MTVGNRESAGARDSGRGTRDAFLEAAFWYGGVEKAKAILDEHPEIAADFFVAAALGDDVTVRRFLEEDPSLATKTDGPRTVDALTYLCFSRFLAHDKSRSEAFVRAATRLLDAGADPNGGFFDGNHTPKPERESVLYGAAGVAFHAGVTRLLLERGADPNDAEVPYHSPETYDNDALKVLLDSGKLNQWSLTTILLRKMDFHDLDGARLALDAGADPNDHSYWRRTALHHSILSDNRLAIIELLLDRGSDPVIVAENLNHGGPWRAGTNAFVLAARRGRGDVLSALQKRGFRFEFEATDAAIAACAHGRSTTVDAETREVVRAEAGMLLCEFAGNDNASGIACLLDVGLPIDAPYGHADGYFDVTPQTTALHNAAWRGAHDTVELLVRRGANVNARDSKHRTPLIQAIRAATESYWMNRRSPRSIKALLDAGATTDGVKRPTGYDEADALLARPCK